MAASQRPRTVTASTCTPQTAQGTHVFKISGYSLHRGLGVGNSIQSATFSVGGYDWYIRFYPDGQSSSDNYADYVAVFLHVTSKNTEVRASFDFRLVDQATGQSTVLANQVTPKVFKASAWGMRRFKKRSELEVSAYMRDDCLVIECNVTVIIKEPCVEETTIAPKFEVQVPPSDLSRNLGKLLEGKKGADVTFKIKDEVIPAHKIVLAMRSPVFSAELYGPIRENTRQCIAVEDMHPDIFRPLLHFIYTDTMPTMEEFVGHERKEMIKCLWLQIGMPWKD